MSNLHLLRQSPYLIGGVKRDMVQLDFVNNSWIPKIRQHIYIHIIHSISFEPWIHTFDLSTHNNILLVPHSWSYSSYSRRGFFLHIPEEVSFWIFQDGLVNIGPLQKDVITYRYRWAILIFQRWYTMYTYWWPIKKETRSDIDIHGQSMSLGLTMGMSKSSQW